MLCHTCWVLLVCPWLVLTHESLENPKSDFLIALGFLPEPFPQAGWYQCLLMAHTSHMEICRETLSRANVGRVYCRTDLGQMLQELSQQ